MADGRKNTIQRQVIFEAVKKLNMHATAEQVYDYVVLEHPSISKATVYRNLNQMVEANELITIGNLSGAAHFDHNCHKHYHFVCDDCKRIFDVDIPLPGIYNQITSVEGFEIKDHNLNLSGLCRDCKAQ
ncbi:MAG: transcriptional repressor [Treponema sp.]|nr:transcriptional repressor [Treponema sp.]